MIITLALVAILATESPVLATVSPPNHSQPTSAASIPERLIAHRARLRLSVAQVDRLSALGERYRFQENQDRVSSKPWLARAPSPAVARDQSLKVLMPEQRREARAILGER